jgi:hypothetical protein
MGLVASYPGRADDTDPGYTAWRERVVRWVRELFGDDRILGIVEHRDESYGHIHALAHDHGRTVKTLHPGHASALRATRAGASTKAAGDAYKAGMRRLQDHFHERVGEPSGLTRLGPGRARLTRAEWQHAKALSQQLAATQARSQKLGEALAEREKLVQTLSSRLEVNRTALADRARGLVDRSRELDERERRVEAQEARRRAELIVLETQRAEREQLEREVEILRAQLAQAGSVIEGQRNGPLVRPHLGSQQ